MAGDYSNVNFALYFSETSRNSINVISQAFCKFVTINVFLKHVLCRYDLLVLSISSVAHRRGGLGGLNPLPEAINI